MKNKQLKKVVNNLVDLSFKDGKMVESQVSKSIKVLKSLPKFQAIEALGEYLKELKRLEKKYTLIIETSTQLSQAQVKKIKKVMAKKGKVTKVVTQMNPSILGGFILKLGDEVWDHSMLDKINQVKEAITGSIKN